MIWPIFKPDFNPDFNKPGPCFFAPSNKELPSPAGDDEHFENKLPKPLDKLPIPFENMTDNDEPRPLTLFIMLLPILPNEEPSPLRPDDILDPNPLNISNSPESCNLLSSIICLPASRLSTERLIACKCRLVIGFNNSSVLCLFLIIYL